MLGLAVLGFLAGNAQAHAGDGLAPRLGNLRVALFAALEAGALGQLVAHALDAVLDGGIDLVLHGAVAGPTRGHGLLRKNTTMAG